MSYRIKLLSVVDEIENASKNDQNVVPNQITIPLGLALFESSLQTPQQRFALRFAGYADLSRNSMSNRFGIESPDEQALRARDRSCVYCHKAMKTFPEIKAGNGDRRDLATIEHLNFDPPFYVKDGLRTEDIAICCFACNASRGKRRLWEWFTMPYCRVRDINVETIAQPVKRYLCEVPPELSQFVEFASWNFAKTYAENSPHEYVSRDHVDNGLFDALARCIFSRGYEGRYYQRMYIYFDYNGHSYWHIKDIINRSATSETYERRERENRLPASPRGS